jgi:hypothetical protein
MISIKTIIGEYAREQKDAGRIVQRKKSDPCGTAAIATRQQ